MAQSVMPWGGLGNISKLKVILKSRWWRIEWEIM